MSKRIFPIIKISNKSNKELGNLIFTYDDCKCPRGVRWLKENSQKEVKIANKSIEYDKSLFLIYRDKKGNKKRYIIEENFNKNYDYEINLDVYDVSDYGELEFNIKKIQ